jgi:hypothetical protein
MGTAAAAGNLLLAFAFVQPPTFSPLLGRSSEMRHPQPVTTQSLEDADLVQGQDGIVRTPVLVREGVVERPTTPREKLIGEIRRLKSLKQNWDGEGAAAPSDASMKAAAALACLLSDDENRLPEPMLHASGRAGLYWKASGLYADLEFLGDERVAYYIERDGGKHKGVVTFDSDKMPAVLATLLPS